MPYLKLIIDWNRWINGEVIPYLYWVTIFLSASDGFVFGYIFSEGK
jgi:hypothetical protein